MNEDKIKKAMEYHLANKERRNAMTKARYQEQKKPSRGYSNKIDDVAMDNYIKMLEGK